MMSTHPRRKILWAGVVMGIVVLLMILPALCQEGNPLPLLAGVLQLEMSGQRIVLIHHERLLLMQKASEDASPLTDYLAAVGWQFSERLGSALFYTRDETVLSVHARQFTRRYVIYELDGNLLP